MNDGFIVSIDEKELAFSIIPSPMTRVGKPEVGVQLMHIPSGVTVISVNESTQYKNKLLATDLLLKHLIKR